ncbi:class I SAM-dependent methyltransferase [uncultured Microscilla sp.]|uniref:class I SAM-dependent methyltransferase n=1 Tax=uncultured Microscilla sp. TaxID=432653 RepID=UPI0026294B88|nr:class I SAM-dependent methyltransferase [uncultured Microscilla sp.]
MAKEITLLNPYNQQPLEVANDKLIDAKGKEFEKVAGAYRLVQDDNYTENFGFQWNKFAKTQIDRFSEQSSQSKTRFFAVTKWDNQDLSGENVLEVGSGAGRFSQVVLDETNANLYSVDYSNAVEANFKNNGHHQDRLQLFQASIYELPFAPASFDRVFCFGVLQHTPDVKKSVQSLAQMVKPGGELLVDFYPIRGWWTKIHAKYIFRPWTKRMSHEKLLRRIEKNAGWMIRLSQFFNRIGIGKLTNRFIPICDIKNTLPPDLTKEQLKEWVILDTFDMFSPEYDQPQRVETVRQWFEEFGIEVDFAGTINFEGNNLVTAVKGIKKG